MQQRQNTILKELLIGNYQVNNCEQEANVTKPMMQQFSPVAVNQMQNAR